MKKGEGIIQRTIPINMDNSVGIDYGSGGAVWVEGGKGGKIGTTNSINNKIFLKRCYVLG